VEWVQQHTLDSRRRLYLLARVVVARNYRRRLTLAAVARAVSSSPRQVQRAYAQFGQTSFQEDLRARRLAAAAQLLAEQPAICVRDVAQLVGYRQAPHFARAFRRRYGLAPALFRQRARAHRAGSHRGQSAGAQTVERSRGAVSPGDGAEVSRGDASASSGSAPGSVSRISVPPPGADSAPTLPRCCSAT
jgi:AraC family transcriptional regulator, regulatory protein of adaptative response / methylphosphotriester-DNA alkyltransferase methyltransferase